MVITEEIAYFWFSQALISPYKFNKLIEIYSALEVYEELTKNSKFKDFFGDKKYAELLHSKDPNQLEYRLDELYKLGIKYLPSCDELFPNCLAQSQVNPPIGLYYIGDISLLNTTCVAIVGTRSCSRYGKDMAERFATDFSNNNITVVSGLATGIDMYAHLATLNAGGKTIAVLGSGLNKVGPVSNINLFKRIAVEGLALSEYPPNVEGTTYTFPERNRIVSGLSDAVVVVEAAFKSGALITAQCCLDQNRELCIVPANVGSPKSMGTNDLLRKGIGHFVTCGEDVCNIISYDYNKGIKKYIAIQLDIFQQKIYNKLSEGDESFDNLVLELGMSAQELSCNLSKLEINGIIRKKQSNIYSIVRE